jgi:DNA-binding response OmpR family regulator
MKLLIIEDEVELCQTISNFLKKEIDVVMTAFNKKEATDKLLYNQYEIIILDIGLPDGNGLDILATIKKYQENPCIIIISAKNSLDDKVNGLDLGADDYITKPFHLAELNSRIKALTRRKIFQSEDILNFNEIAINLSENQAYINSSQLELTKKEYALLLYFITNKNRVLTKESIAEHLWGDSIDFLENYDFIYTHIKNLRKKIDRLGGTDYLKTVHGIGYKYC